VRVPYYIKYCYIYYIKKNGKGKQVMLCYTEERAELLLWAIIEPRAKSCYYKSQEHECFVVAGIRAEQSSRKQSSEGRAGRQE
jgi:hypothetical protein